MYTARGLGKQFTTDYTPHIHGSIQMLLLDMKISLQARCCAAGVPSLAKQNGGCKCQTPVTVFIPSYKHHIETTRIQIEIYLAILTFHLTLPDVLAQLRSPQDTLLHHELETLAPSGETS